MAACSENATRFADPLFTGSLSDEPVKVDKFGNPAQGSNFAAATPLPPSAPPPDQVFPQRVDVNGQQPRVANTFTARNVSRLARDRDFRPGELANGQQQIASAPATYSPSGLHSSRAGTSTGIRSQPLPPVQSIPQSAVLAEVPSTTAAPEDVSAPLLARRAPAVEPAQPTAITPSAAISQSVPEQTAEAQQETGTSWTRLYSPVPTASPRSRSAFNRSGRPAAYSPPSGNLPANVDALTTSSVTRSNGPRIVRAAEQPRQVAQRSGSGTHTVKSGDTLASISRKTNVRIAALRSANGIGNDNVIRVGQRLVIPGATSATGGANTNQLVQTVSAPAVTAAPAGRVQTASLQRVQPVPTIAPQRPEKAAEKKPALTETKPAEPGGLTRVSVDALPKLDSNGKVKPYSKPAVREIQVASREVDDGPQTPSRATRFQWPVRGDVISEFGGRLNGNRNDGINIEAPRGTPVRATAGGDVFYASDDLKGYGKMVLVRHSNGFVSAYAHVDNLKVEQGDRVRQGQVIA
ncbi:MAG: peptidoglycan DD-metalloendopeptidase family protein, partial [Pseudomonadota bacterium]